MGASVALVRLDEAAAQVVEEALRAAGFAVERRLVSRTPYEASLTRTAVELRVPATEEPRAREALRLFEAEAEAGLKAELAAAVPAAAPAPEPDAEPASGSGPAPDAAARRPLPGGALALLFVVALLFVISLFLHL